MLTFNTYTVFVHMCVMCPHYQPTHSRNGNTSVVFLVIWLVTVPFFEHMMEIRWS